MVLDFSSFEKALGNLKTATADLHGDPANEYIKDSIVKRFEYTHEMAHKILRRFLAATADNGQEIKEMSFADLIRTACSKGLLRNDLKVWASYREMRNSTSHAYDGSKANQIIAKVPDFIVDADFLLGKLKEKTVISNAIPPGDGYEVDA